MAASARRKSGLALASRRDDPAVSQEGEVVADRGLALAQLLAEPADVLLPFSDHADFPDLLRHVADVGARRVVAMHGFARDFARILAARGDVGAAALVESAERTAEDA